MRQVDQESAVMLIWDSEEEAPGNYNTVVLWNRFNKSEKSNVISAPELVEGKSDFLRSKFLSWVFDFGESYIGGKRIVDILELSNGLSYWWFTSLGQKFNVSGESGINDVIKTLAVEPFISKNEIQLIHIVTGNTKLLKLFRAYSKNQCLKFSFKLLNTNKGILKSVYSILPNFFQALLYFLWYLKMSIPFLTSVSPETRKFQGDIMFMDVLVHLDKKSLETNKFLSNYWTTLTDLLSQLKLRSNWLHNFYKHKDIPGVFEANALLEKFNKSEERQSHSLIESFLTPLVFINAAKIYFKLFFSSIKLSGSTGQYQPEGSLFNFLPLIKQEFFESVRGKNAIKNCIRISLAEAVFKRIPYQKSGFYLQENQPWEFALIHAWKRNNHGKLTGVPHSTVRYWDLRYFYDPKTFSNNEKNGLPVPDLVAVNGPASKNAYLKGGYPANQLVNCEALRFMYLTKAVQSKPERIKATQNLTVLLCGDFLASTNNLMIRCLEGALKLMTEPVSVIIKPHPANLLQNKDYPCLNFEISEAPLSELFLNCSVVFTSNITSAAVDAYCTGIPLIQFREGSSFNMSPLRDVAGVSYVIDSNELAGCLKNILPHPHKPESYFFLDPTLNFWKGMLNEHRHND